MNPETSILIRTRNEERWIGTVLEKIFSQTYKDFEVIVIDSGSTDKTLPIVSQFPAQIVRIKSEEFSYPHALNIGAQHSKGRKYLVILSGHSIPVSRSWLASGISNFALDENIMGIYGPLKAMPDGTVWDKIIHSCSYGKEFLLCFPKKYRLVRHSDMGILGFTNAIVRKDLWEKHHFDEAYGAGGEDGEWVRFWLARGYSAVKDLRFAVRHSHYLNAKQRRQQFKYWSSLKNPRPFQRLTFRKDGAHKE